MADADDDEHFPWHYTEFGVVCACGAPMDRDENCLANTEEQTGCGHPNHGSDDHDCAPFTEEQTNE